MQPIYEQIVSQIKNHITHGELQEEEMLPSVRTLAKELKGLSSQFMGKEAL